MHEATRRILVVEDEADLAELITFNLEREGYQCDRAGDGIDAMAKITGNTPSLIVLDRMLPGLSGDEVIARMRRDPSLARIPVIMLTAKAEESDELVGFALGADDYLTKPFSMKVLLARVAALLRRQDSPQDVEDSLSAGPICLISDRHEVTIHGRAVSLTATEFKLLRALMAAKGRVLDRNSLIDAALGLGVVVTDRTIDVHITGLRKKIGVASAWIQTIRGVGYTCREPANEQPAG